MTELVVTGARPLESSAPTRLGRLSGLNASLLIVVLGFLVYGFDASRMFFYADDWYHIRTAEISSRDKTLARYLPWITASRPLARDLIAVAADQFGLRPEPYHYSQLALHLATTLMVLWLARQLTGDWSGALSASLVFLVNRFAFLPVAWLATTFDLVAGFLAVACLATYVRFSTDERQPWWAGLGAIVFFSLGLKANEHVLLLAPLLLQFSLLLGHFQRAWRLAPAGPAAARAQAALRLHSRRDRVVLFSICVIAALFYWFNHFPEVASDHPYYSSFAPGALAKAYGWYLSQLTFTPRWPDSLLLALAVLGTTILIWLPQARLLLWCWCFGWFTLLATASLANHFDNCLCYAYMAMLGPSLLVGALVAWVKRGAWRKLLLAGVGGFVAGSLAWLVHSDEAKWYRAVTAQARTVMIALQESYPADSQSNTIVLMGLPPNHPFVYGNGLAANVWLGRPSLEVLALDRRDGHELNALRLDPRVPILYWDEGRKAFIRLR